MKIEQRKWTKEQGWEIQSPQSFALPPQIVFVFGGIAPLKDSERFHEIQKWYPNSHLLFCSTAGEIFDTQVSDDSLSLTAVFFEKTTLAFASKEITQSSESLSVGKALAQDLPQKDLQHVMVFTDGLLVNGTSLVSGLVSILPKEVAVTGGLVGDGGHFKETLVGLDMPPKRGGAVAIGFYGSDLHIGYGSFGGWDTFGPERIITKSKENVLYEIDNQPALSLYKEYLGDQAKDLPGSGLLFPISLHLTQNDGSIAEVVRTVLGVNEKDQSMTFAGDMPEGIRARLMRANFEKLVDGASDAAGKSVEALGTNSPDLAILISCIGRKLVLKERVEEEVEAVREKIGKRAAITGFYSYGEICPTAPTEKQCQLHNQTMTITTFRE